MLKTCTKPTADNISSNETSNQAANIAPKSHSAQKDPVLENNDGSTDQEQSAGKDDSQIDQPKADMNPHSSADLPSHSHSQAENGVD